MQAHAMDDVRSRPGAASVRDGERHDCGKDGGVRSMLRTVPPTRRWRVARDSSRTVNMVASGVRV